MNPEPGMVSGRLRAAIMAQVGLAALAAGVISRQDLSKSLGRGADKHRARVVTNSSAVGEGPYLVDKRHRG